MPPGGGCFSVPALPEAPERPSWAAGYEKVHWQLGRAFGRPCCQPVDRTLVAELLSLLLLLLPLPVTWPAAWPVLLPFAWPVARPGLLLGLLLCLLLGQWLCLLPVWVWRLCRLLWVLLSCCSGPWLLIVWLTLAGIFLAQAIPDGGQDQGACCCFLKFICLFDSFARSLP